MSLNVVSIGCFRAGKLTPIRISSSKVPYPYASLCIKAPGRQQLFISMISECIVVERLNLLTEYEKSLGKPLHFDGFYSLFLCRTMLDGFSFDDGNVDRKKDLSLQEFYNDYDGKNRYDKKIRYETRKARAESRIRIKGRFAKMDR
ncbi:hypothetical protein ACH5RR_023941 [Cinchona calisaya]|uniref:CCT domain-containing protein n=1 Tax=Cinchona calisaya TaxID=153742 RepID=A0ABD2ZD67_9GENT